MKGLFCAVVLVLGVVGNDAAKVSPVAKVIELLDDLKGKVAADLAAEEAEMVEYTKYCDDESSERNYAITSATKSIARLKAEIEDGNAQVAAAADEISTMSSEIAQKETELANAMKLRKAEKGDFKKTESSLIKADDELKAAEVLVKQEMSFVQVAGKSHSRKMSPKGLKALTAALSNVIDSTALTGVQKSKAQLQGFLQATESADDADMQMPGSGAPEADAYESHSEGIVGTIKDLEVKDEDQLADVRKGEMQEQHSFDMMKATLMDAISLLKKKVSDSAAKKSALAEQAAAATGEMVETEKTKAADEAFLQALTNDCTTTAAGWEERKKSAAEEMAAIEKAKEILANGVKALVQVSSKQVSAASVQKKAAVAKKGDDDADAREDTARAQITKILKDLGHQYNSYALMEMASAAGADPFGKVRGLINDMITKLMDEAAQEASQKAFCDEEIGKSRKSQAEKSRKMDQTRTRIDEAATTKATLEESVKDLEGEIAAIDAAQAEATKLRNEEHATYLKAASDYKQSADAVSQAMAVLSEYYGKSFVQVKSVVAKKGKQPEFGSATGQDTATVILGILEVSASDFTKLLAETEAGEAEAVATYDKLSKDNAVSKASKQAEVKGKQSETKSLTVALAHHNEDYKMVEKEYAAVMDYLDKLKPECETKAMSYAEKKARRENEIEGLKEALGIIEGTAVPGVEE